MVERRAPSRLVQCAACRRHVRVADARCPFCGAAASAERVAPLPELRGRSRAGRALLGITLGLGAAQAAAACGTAMPTADPAGAASPPEPTATSQAGRGSRSAVPAAATSAPPPAPSDSVEVVPRRVVAIYGSTIVLLAPVVLFDLGSARLPPSADPMLVEVVETLKVHPEFHVAVEGHSEKVEADNLKLSERRAGAVLEKLVELGLDRARVRILGIGPSAPRTEGKTEEERAQNRYVGFRVTNVDGSPLGP